MCSDHGRGTGSSTGKAPVVDIPRGRRRAFLWEYKDPIHCSVVGTCATVADLRRMADRLDIRFKDGTRDYDLHGYVVQELTRDTPFARLFHKTMDDRHAGAIRRFLRARTEEEILALWCEMRDKGAIPAAYWAVMTCRSVPIGVRNPIFGEVHMLSHLLGASYCKRTAEAAELRRDLEEAEERLRRLEAGKAAALAERDRQIETLRRETIALRGRHASPAPRAAPADADRARRRAGKLERALKSVRVRARQAEERVAELERRLAEGRMPRPRGGPDDGAPASPADRALSADWLRGRSILYVGGQPGTVERLRLIAREFEAELVHHDGGLEDARVRLDRLLPSVDCVLCPVNCVSHDACLRAKRACQALDKPFLPLRSASQTAFRTALERIAAAPAAGQRPGREGPS